LVRAHPAACLRVRLANRSPQLLFCFPLFNC
jgi:hypothetical protein